MNAVLVDTGFLVALFRRDDRLRGTARDYLEAHNHPLVTVAPVIVETCLFLDARGTHTRNDAHCCERIHLARRSIRP